MEIVLYSYVDLGYWGDLVPPGIHWVVEMRSGYGRLVGTFETKERAQEAFDALREDFLLNGSS